MNETEKDDGPAKAALSERVRSLRLTESSDAGGPGASWRTWIPWGLCALLLCTAGGFALEALSPIDDELIKKLAQERGLNVGKGSADPNAGKFVLPGSPGTGSATVEIALESKGYVVPYQLIQLSPKVTGTVIKLNIKEGKAVKEGDLLAVLENVEFQSDYDRCVSSVVSAYARIDELKTYRAEEVQQAKAELDDAIAQAEQMEAKYERNVKLKKRTAVSDEDYEAAVSGHLSMKARVEKLRLAHQLLVKGPRDSKIATAEGDYRQALADLDKARWRLKNTKIKAPIDGIILSKKTEEGNLVNPSAFSSGLSASLCEMADLYDLEIDLSIAERDIAKVFKDQECRIRAEAFPERIYTGYVSRIMPTADRNKASVPVRVVVQFPAMDKKGQPLPMEEQGEFLRPEMGAIVTFLNRKTTDMAKIKSGK